MAACFDCSLWLWLLCVIADFIFYLWTAIEPLSFRNRTHNRMNLFFVETKTKRTKWIRHIYCQLPMKFSYVQISTRSDRISHFFEMFHRVAKQLTVFIHFVIRSTNYTLSFDSFMLTQREPMWVCWFSLKTCTQTLSMWQTPPKDGHTQYECLCTKLYPEHM